MCVESSVFRRVNLPPARASNRRRRRRRRRRHCDTVAGVCVGRRRRAARP